MGFDPWISEWGNPLDCSLLWLLFAARPVPAALAAAPVPSGSVRAAAVAGAINSGQDRVS